MKRLVTWLMVILLIPLSLHAQGTAPVVQIVYSPDGVRAASLDTDGIVRVWDGRAPRLITLIAANAIAIALPDAETLVGLTRPGTVYTWEIDTGELLDTHRPDALPDNLGDDLRVGALSTDGRYAVLGGAQSPRETSADGLWWLWDTLTNQTDTEETYGRVYEVGFAPSGALVTISTAMSSCGRGGGGVLLWDAAANEQQRFFTQAGTGLDHAVVSPDGKFFAGVGFKTRCVGTTFPWVWDITSGEQISHLWANARTLAFRPGSSQLALANCIWEAGIYDRCAVEFLTLWDFASHTPDGLLMQTSRTITAAAFHPLGDLITVGTDDGNLVMLPIP